MFRQAQHDKEDAILKQVLMFIFVLIQKRTKKIKTSIFDVQLPFHALKRLNDSLLANLFCVCFNELKLVCKSYVALEFYVKKRIRIIYE